MRGGEKRIFGVLRFLDLFTRVGYRLRLHLNCLQVLTPFIVYKVEVIIKAIMLVRYYSQRFKKKKKERKKTSILATPLGLLSRSSQSPRVSFEATYEVQGYFTVLLGKKYTIASPSFSLWSFKRPFAASYSRRTKPPCWIAKVALGQDKQ